MDTTQQPFKNDPLWHVQVAVLLALVLQLLLPVTLVAGPRYILPILEVVLLLSLTLTTPKGAIFRSAARRTSAITLSACISVANIYSLFRLAQDLLAGGRISNGHELIIASINIYVTNIIIFGLWYWEIDAGGPGKRAHKELHERDFLFSQTAVPAVSPKNWMPTFFDYLYVSSTNATAFSPTDTMPLTHRVKLLMSVQAIVSLITIALVAARAVNILN